MAVVDLGGHDTQSGPIRCCHRNARFLSTHTRERGEAVDALTNIVLFRRVYGKEFGLASCFGLTDGNETFLFSGRARWIAPSRGVLTKLSAFTWRDNGNSVAARQ